MDNFCTKATQLKGAKLVRQATEDSYEFNNIGNIQVESDLPLIGTKKVGKPTETASTKKTKSEDTSKKGSSTSLDSKPATE